MANEFRVKNGIITPKIISEESDGRVVLTQIATGDDEPIILAFETAETDIAANDVLGKITFAAPDEGTGTDANLVAAGIQAKSEGDFANDSNATSLEFMTGSSEAATAKWKITSAGVFAPTSSNTFDLGIAGAGTINDIHFSSGGRLTFNGSDVTLTHSSNLLTIAGGALTAPTLRYSTSFLSDKEVSASGAGVKIGENAKFTHIQKPEAIMQHDADVASGDRSWDNGGTDIQTSVFSLNQTNAHVSFNKVEDANSAAEQMYHMCFINLDDDNYSMWIGGSPRRGPSGGGRQRHRRHSRLSACRDSKSHLGHWWLTCGYVLGGFSLAPYNWLQAGEFVALKWNDGTSNWMVIAYVNFVAQTNTKINVSAHIRALERPKIIQG